MDAKKKILNEKGQALIELVFFIPLFVFLLIILITIGNSINGSINQQKATRGYFFSRLKNNSLMPLRDESHKNFRSFGMFFIGWAQRLESDNPIQPCYKFNIPFSEEESCDSYQGESTRYIRVGTVFGLCGASYVKADVGAGGQVVAKTPVSDNIDFSSTMDGCLIR